MLYWIVNYKNKEPGGYSQKQFRTEAKAWEWYADRKQKIAEGKSRRIEKVDAPVYREVIAVIV